VWIPDEIRRATSITPQWLNSQFPVIPRTKNRRLPGGKCREIPKNFPSTRQNGNKAKEKKGCAAKGQRLAHVRTQVKKLKKQKNQGLGKEKCEKKIVTRGRREWLKRALIVNGTVVRQTM